MNMNMVIPKDINQILGGISDSGRILNKNIIFEKLEQLVKENVAKSGDEFSWVNVAGEQLTKKGFYNQAVKLFFSIGIHSKDDMELRLSCRTNAAKSLIRMLELHFAYPDADKVLPDGTTVEECATSILEYVKDNIEEICSIADEKQRELQYWHIYNAAMLTSCLSKTLYCFGYGKLAVDYIVLCIMAMEEIIPLCAAKFLSLKCELHHLVFSCFEQSNNHEACRNVASSLQKIVQDLKMTEEIELPVPQETQKLIENGLRESTVLELRVQLYHTADSSVETLRDIFLEKIGLSREGLVDHNFFKSIEQRMDCLSRVIAPLGEYRMMRTETNPPLGEDIANMIGELIEICQKSSPAVNNVSALVSLMYFLFQYRQWNVLSSYFVMLETNSVQSTLGVEIELLQGLYCMKCPEPVISQFKLDHSLDSIQYPIPTEQGRKVPLSHVLFVCNSLNCAMEYGISAVDMAQDTAIWIWSTLLRPTLSNFGSYDEFLRDHIVGSAMKVLEFLHFTGFRDIIFRGTISLHLAKALFETNHDLRGAVQILRKSLRMIDYERSCMRESESTDSDTLAVLHADTWAYYCVVELSTNSKRQRSKIQRECQQNPQNIAIFNAIIAGSTPEIPNYEDIVSKVSQVMNTLKPHSSKGKIASKNNPDTASIEPPLVVSQSTNKIVLRIPECPLDKMKYLRVFGKLSTNTSQSLNINCTELSGTGVKCKPGQLVTITGMLPNATYEFAVGAFNGNDSLIGGNLGASTHAIGAWNSYPELYVKVLVTKLIYKSLLSVFENLNKLSGILSSTVDGISKCLEYCNTNISEILDAFVVYRSRKAEYIQDSFCDWWFDKEKLKSVPPACLKGLGETLLMRHRITAIRKRTKTEFEAELVAFDQLRYLIMGIYVATALSDFEMLHEYATYMFDVAKRFLSKDAKDLRVMHVLVGLVKSLLLVDRRDWPSRITQIYAAALFHVVRYCNAFKESHALANILIPEPAEISHKWLADSADACEKGSRFDSSLNNDLDFLVVRFLQASIFPNMHELDKNAMYQFAEKFKPVATDDLQKEGKSTSEEEPAKDPLYLEDILIDAFVQVRENPTKDNIEKVFNILDVEMASDMPDHLYFMCCALRLSCDFADFDTTRKCADLESYMYDCDDSSTSHVTNFVKLVLDEEMLEHEAPYHSLNAHEYPLVDKNLHVSSSPIDQLEPNHGQLNRQFTAQVVLNEVSGASVNRRVQFAEHRLDRQMDLDNYQLAALAEMDLICTRAEYHKWLAVDPKRDHSKMPFKGLLEEGPRTDLIWQATVDADDLAFEPPLEKIDEQEFPDASTRNLDTATGVLETQKRYLELRRALPNVLHKCARGVVRARWGQHVHQFHEGVALMWNMLTLADISPREFRNDALAIDSLKPTVQEHVKRKLRVLDNVDDDFMLRSDQVSESDDLSVIHAGKTPRFVGDWKILYRTSCAIVDVLEIADVNGISIDDPGSVLFLFVEFTLHALLHLRRWVDLYALGKRYDIVSRGARTSYVIQMLNMSMDKIIGEAIERQLETKDQLSKHLQAWQEKQNRKQHRTAAPKRPGNLAEIISPEEQQYRERKSELEGLVEHMSDRVSILQEEVRWVQERFTDADTKRNKFKKALDTARALRKQVLMEHLMEGRQLKTAILPFELTKPSSTHNSGKSVSGRSTTSKSVSSKVTKHTTRTSASRSVYSQSAVSEEEFDVNIDSGTVSKAVAAYRRALSEARTSKNVVVELQTCVELGDLLVARGGTKSRTEALTCWSGALDSLLETPNMISSWRDVLRGVINKDMPFGRGDYDIVTGSCFAGQAFLTKYGVESILYAIMCVDRLVRFLDVVDEEKKANYLRVGAHLTTAIISVDISFPMRFVDYATYEIVQFPDVVNRELTAQGFPLDDFYSSIVGIAHRLSQGITQRDRVMSFPLWSIAERVAHRYFNRISDVVEVRLRKSVAAANSGLVKESWLAIANILSTNGGITIDYSFSNNLEPWSEDNAKLIEFLMGSSIWDSEKKLKESTNMCTLRYAIATFLYRMASQWTSNKVSLSHTDICKTISKLLDVCLESIANETCNCTKHDEVDITVLRLNVLRLLGQRNESIQMAMEKSEEWSGFPEAGYNAMMDCDIVMATSLLDRNEFTRAVQLCERSLARYVDVRGVDRYRALVALYTQACVASGKVELGLSKMVESTIHEFQGVDEVVGALHECRAVLAENLEAAHVAPYWLDAATCYSAAHEIIGASHNPENLYIPTTLRFAYSQLQTAKFFAEQNNHTRASETFHIAESLVCSMVDENLWLKSMISLENARFMRGAKRDSRNVLIASLMDMEKNDTVYDLGLLRSVYFELCQSDRAHASYWLTQLSKLASWRTGGADSILSVVSKVGTTQLEIRQHNTNPNVTGKLPEKMTLAEIAQVYSSVVETSSMEKSQVARALHLLLTSNIPEFKATCTWKIEVPPFAVQSENENPTWTVANTLEENEEDREDQKKVIRVQISPISVETGVLIASCPTLERDKSTVYFKSIPMSLVCNNHRALRKLRYAGAILSNDEYRGKFRALLREWVSNFEVGEDIALENFTEQFIGAFDINTGQDIAISDDDTILQWWHLYLDSLSNI